MKRLALTIAGLAFVVGVAAATLNWSTSEAAAAPSACTTIQDGTLQYAAGHYLQGQPLVVGYDDYGYNYQAHLFVGSYANVYLGGAGFPAYTGDDASYLTANPAAANHWAWPYRSVSLDMKWNDAWLSNRDCDDNGKLDRHYGYASYLDSGAWITNHMVGDDGGVHWTYFTKIIAAPSDATIVSGIYVGADGTDIGPEIWGEFATVLEAASGEGAYYVSPSGPGFGAGHIQ